MNLREIANSVSVTVNPNTPLTVLISTGFTVGNAGRQQPSYAEPVSGFGQVQALDAQDLQQLAGLNIQGTIRAIYLRGEIVGVVTPNQTGGDIINIGSQQWLTVRVLEGWPTWTKIAAVLQGQTQ